MACFSVVCNNGFFISQEKFGVHGVKTKSLASYRGFCCTSFVFPSLGLPRYSKSLHGLYLNNKRSSLINRKSGLGFYTCCNNGIEPLRSGNTGNKQTHLGKRENGYVRLRKRFSLRLRPRLRLLNIRLKTVSIRSMLNEIGTFLRKNLRRVALSTSISIALGLCYLIVKLTAVPTPKIVPYSNLILSLQNGSVTKVLLEEGSRRIFYNENLQSVVSTQTSNEESPERNVATENGADEVAADDGSKSITALNVSVLKKFTRTRASNPEWQYYTRKIDHDEKFLLSLMREKGISYSSAPQSMLALMRSTLITILSLWIPLIPLMWLLYRQLSAANSPARKRQPNNQMVGFDDVEGVDGAKVELMEVRFLP
jgi:hypothetical protein